MPNLILSTVGTSLLTNPIDRTNPAESTWQQQLRNSANQSPQNLDPQTAQIVQTLCDRASANLKSGEIPKIRRASAELNGIYGIYDNQLARGKADVHWLVPTNTAQGLATATVVRDFLRDVHGLNANLYEETKLSTQTTATFSDGIDHLITWLEETLPAYRNSCYRIYFNLVGSFKSLQGYLNTIGMFYADEIVYIFEGQGSELIKIPRLPIAIDREKIAPFALPLALANAGADLAIADLAGIPEGLVFVADDTATLSNWGNLIWNQCKAELLSGDLLPFPHLNYQPTFEADYRNLRDRAERVKLQETLATVSTLLARNNGNRAALTADGSLQYSPYKGQKSGRQTDHFRVGLSQRATCQHHNGQLHLRHYGSHDYTERKESV